MAGLPVIIRDVPFTLSHTAAALPFRRGLIFSGVVVGTLAPDFEYFLRFSPQDRFGHTLLGAFIFTLPLGLLVLWIFHNVIKMPVFALLPQVLQSRLRHTLYRFRFGPPRRLLLVVVSVLIGIASHLLWDAFTHPTTWLYHHWVFLRQPIYLPVLGWTGYYKLLQHVSTLAGLAVLGLWFAHWYRNTDPVPSASCNRFSPANKVRIVFIITSIAVTAAILRVLDVVSAAAGPVSLQRVAGQAVVTLIALLWWELIIYSLLFRELAQNLPRQDAQPEDSPNFKF